MDKNRKGEAEVCSIIISKRRGSYCFTPRKNAAKILEVRNRPDWLLTSLILASVMVAEGLPLVLNQLLPSDAIWVSFLVSTTAVALFGEIIPQTVMPLYTLEISGRCMWFVKTVMYLNAIPAFIPAYALRKFRCWRKRKEPYKMDGIMDMDELMEFVRLHEQSECHGGQLLDEAGTLVRTVMEHQKVSIFEVIRPWTCALLLETTSWITPAVVNEMKNCNDAYAIVIVREVGIGHAGSVFEENEGREPQIPSLSAQLAGILLAKVGICREQLVSLALAYLVIIGLYLPRCPA